MDPRRRRRLVTSAMNKKILVGLFMRWFYELNSLVIQALDTDKGCPRACSCMYLRSGIRKRYRHLSVLLPTSSMFKILCDRE